MRGKVVDNTFDHIQLFRERLSEKMCTRQSMGYDQYSVPDTLAVELTFVAFL